MARLKKRTAKGQGFFTKTLKERIIHFQREFNYELANLEIHESCMNLGLGKTIAVLQYIGASPWRHIFVGPTKYIPTITFQKKMSYEN